MKFHDKTNLCLTHDEYAACFGADAYKNDKKRGKIIVFGVGGNGREVLIDFETLPEDRRTRVVKKFGDPYKYVLTQPITDWVQINWNEKAREFYNSTYRLPNGNKLPEAYRDKYTKAITYLDAVQYYTTDKMALKRDFNIKMEAFWNILADVFKAENVALPKNRICLQRKLQEYKEAGFNTPAGFELLIEKFRFDNENSKKVKDQVAEDTLMKLIELDNKHDDVVLAAAYNQWALANGRKNITPQAVGYRRRKYYHEVAMARDGKAQTYNAYSKQIKQRRPSAPLMLVNSDDNVLDLYFKEIYYSNGKKVTDKYYRPVMYVVIDAFNDYILGYAVGEVVTIELIKEAYRNAMQHVIELTGAPHLWHQIKSDKWSIDPELKGDLATFFKNQSIFFPAEVAQSKYIERVFGKPLHKVLKVFPNYSGANITARGKNARPNTEALQKRSKDFPEKQQAVKVIEMAIHTMRHSIVTGTEKTRQEMWLEAFNTSDFCAKKAINYERHLELFGKKLEPKQPARLRVDGLNFQINNVKYSFDVPGSLFPEYLNHRVEVVYDPADMSRVLVTDHKGLRFVANEYRLQPSAIADMQEGDRKMLDERLAEKHAITQKLTDYVVQREERIQRAKINAESLIQANVLTKAINHKAQKTLSGYQLEDSVIHLPVTSAGSIYDEV